MKVNSTSIDPDRVYQVSDACLSIYLGQEPWKEEKVLNRIELRWSSCFSNFFAYFGYSWVNFWPHKMQIDTKYFSIDSLPVDHLRGVDWNVLPKSGTYCNIEVNGQNTKLSFPNQTWEDNEKIQILIHYTDTKRMYFTVPLNLQVAGLKKIIYNKNYPHGDSMCDPNFKKWKLLYEDYTLNDDLTLEKCGIKNPKAAVLIKLEVAQDSKGSGAHQRATGGTYESTRNFRQCVNFLEEIIKIVCAIRNVPEQGISTGGHIGSGFLIGKDLIMTNAHVIREKTGEKNYEVKTGQKAVFFHEEEEEKIEVPLIQLIYYSKAPNDYVGLNHVKALDFAIISIDTSGLDAVKFKRINDLMGIADYFFQEKKYKPSELTRANIIQHPSETKPEAKKAIAFRENLIKNVDRFNIHYGSLTEEGSSGSPVINDNGNFIGLHSSGCKVIPRIIYKNPEALFKEAALTSTPSIDPNIYTGKNKEFTLTINRSGNAKGMWDCTKNDEPLKESPYDLVLGKILDKKDAALHREISNFLQKYDFKENIHHRYCNTAICAARIFENLIESRDRKIKDLNKFIPDFTEKPKFSTFQLFWFKKDTFTLVKKAAKYLESIGYELKGVPTGNNSFYEAFEKSYSELPKRSNLSDKKIRDLIFFVHKTQKLTDTGIFEDIDVYEVKQGAELSEALDTVAKDLKLCIKLIKISAKANKAKPDCKVFPISLDQEEKLEECIVIVDLGGHYLYGQPKQPKNQKEVPNKKAILQNEDKQNLDKLVDGISSQKLIKSPLRNQRNWCRILLGFCVVAPIAAIVGNVFFRLYSNKNRSLTNNPCKN